MTGAQVDNLRTNHRGTFVLKDAAFRYGQSDFGHACRITLSLHAANSHYFHLTCSHMVHSGGWQSSP